MFIFLYLAITTIGGQREFKITRMLLTHVFCHLRSFGGTAGWSGDGSPVDEADDSITHHIVDRPTPQQIFENREYVQPQWAFDCANARILLPSDIYAPGKPLPPHLSPFVDNNEEGYVPEYAHKIRRLQVPMIHSLEFQHQAENNKCRSFLVLLPFLLELCILFSFLIFFV